MKIMYIVFLIVIFGLGCKSTDINHNSKVVEKNKKLNLKKDTLPQYPESPKQFDVSMYRDVSASMEGYEIKDSLANLLNSFFKVNPSVSIEKNIKLYKFANDMILSPNTKEWIEPKSKNLSLKGTNLAKIFEEVKKNKSDINFIITDGVATSKQRQICMDSFNLQDIVSQLIFDQEWGLWVYNIPVSFDGEFLIGCYNATDGKIGENFKNANIKVHCDGTRECRYQYKGKKSLAIFIIAKQSLISVIETFHQDFTSYVHDATLLQVWPPEQARDSKIQNNIYRAFLPSPKNKIKYKNENFEKQKTIQPLKNKTEIFVVESIVQQQIQKNKINMLWSKKFVSKFDTNPEDYMLLQEPSEWEIIDIENIYKTTDYGPDCKAALESLRKHSKFEKKPKELIGKRWLAVSTCLKKNNKIDLHFQWNHVYEFNDSWIQKDQLEYIDSKNIIGMKSFVLNIKQEIENQNLLKFYLFEENFAVRIERR
jgi:hypothetical protein